MLAVVMLLLLLAGVLYLLQATISDEAWIATPAPAPTTEQVIAAKSLAKRTLRIFSQERNDTLSVSQSELDGLAALLGRANSRLRTQFNIIPDGVQLTLSVELPRNPFGRYLSSQLVLPVSPQQVTLKQLQLGTLALPDRLLQVTLPWLLDRLFDPQQRQTLLQTVRLTAITNDQLTVAITPPADARQQFRKLLARVQSFSSDNPGLDNARISYYYSQLQQQATQFKPQQWVSVTQFIAPLFRQLAQQTDPEQAQRDTGAALLALAIYLGSSQVEELTGPVVTEQQRRQPPHQRTLLKGRIDLRQHFVVSAALQVLADAGFSHAIGEFKELLDTGKGGSGFSFADLAADRAGTLFALHASRDPQQTLAFLQRFGPPLREADLMISIDKLPEGLTQTQFQDRYQSLQGDAYQQLLGWIDSQLAQLRLYR